MSKSKKRLLIIVAVIVVIFFGPIVVLKSKVELNAVISNKEKVEHRYQVVSKQTHSGVYFNWKNNNSFDAEVEIISRKASSINLILYSWGSSDIQAVCWVDDQPYDVEIKASSKEWGIARNSIRKHRLKEEINDYFNKLPSVIAEEDW